jgi:hypothetical protein
MDEGPLVLGIFGPRFREEQKRILPRKPTNSFVRSRRHSVKLKEIDAGLLQSSFGGLGVDLGRNAKQ